MADGTDLLTGKEKAALRLLLAGHDAKSMANALGLSVHTINERLREARRKLGVSSSKAAARMLKDAEDATPQNLADKPLGDAALAVVAQRFDTGPMPPHPARRIASAVGGTAMLAIVIVTALAVTAPPASSPPPTNAATAPIAESDASRAARDWLALVDARNWPESFAATGAVFRRANSIATWQAAAEAVHARLDPAQSRQLLADHDVPAPPKGSRTVRFRSNFADGETRTETLSLTGESGGWRVVGIYVE